MTDKTPLRLGWSGRLPPVVAKIFALTTMLTAYAKATQTAASNA
jgi:hypothetical protein